MPLFTRVAAKAVAVVIAGAAFTTVQAGAADQVAPTPRSGNEYHQLAYFSDGPGASCVPPGSCGTFAPGLDVVLPARSGTYSGTLTASFNYKTRGSAQFTVRAVVVDSAGHNVGGVHPPSRSLASSLSANSRTMIFGLWGVPGGISLQIQLIAGWLDLKSYPVSIALTGVTEEVRLS